MPREVTGSPESKSRTIYGVHKRRQERLAREATKKKISVAHKNQTTDTNNYVYRAKGAK